MNPLDIMIIALMIFLVVRGIFRGFVREVGSLAGIVFGIWLGIRFEPRLSGYLESYVPPTDYLPLISFALIFFFTLLLCDVLGWILNLILKKAFMGWLNRALGAGLAVTKGVIITYLAIVLLTFYLPSQAPLIARSKLAPLIVVSYQALSGFISPEHYQKWKKRFTGKGGELGELVADKFKQAVEK